MANKIPLILLGCALIAGCKDSRAEGYSVLSKDFIQAIQQVKADYFFAQEVPVKQFSGNITDEEFKKREQIYYVAEHYRSLGEQLCKPMVESYAQMLDSGLTGTDAQIFDEELTRAMREAGAYALPLRIEGRQVDAAYYNPNWDRTPGAKYGGNKQFNEYWRRLRSTNVKLQHSIAPTAYKEGGILEYLFGMSGDGSLSKMTNVFHDILLRQKKFDLVRSEFAFDFVHPYLFVFDKETNDPRAEKMYFYIDLPLTVSGHQFGEVSRVNPPQKEPEVRCYPISTSSLMHTGLRSVTNRKIFEGSGKSLSFITEISPLMIPLPKDYTRSSNNKYEHDIPSANVAEPSVHCWMAAFGYVKDDSDQCLNTGYADEFMEMLNRDFCVGYDFVRPAPTLKYPYHARAWHYWQDFTRGAIYDSRCNPDDQPVINGGHDHD